MMTSQNQIKEKQSNSHHCKKIRKQNKHVCLINKYMETWVIGLERIVCSVPNAPTWKKIVFTAVPEKISRCQHCSSLLFSLADNTHLESGARLNEILL